MPGYKMKNGSKNYMIKSYEKGGLVKVTAYKDGGKVEQNKKAMTESVNSAEQRIRRRKEDMAVAEREATKPTKVHNFETGKPGQTLPKNQTMKVRVNGQTLTVQKNFRDLSPTNPHRLYPDADFGEKQSAKIIEDRINSGRSPFGKNASKKIK